MKMSNKLTLHRHSSDPRDPRDPRDPTDLTFPLTRLERSLGEILLSGR